MKLKKHKNRRPWTYAIGELVKISSYWSQGLCVSNVVGHNSNASTLLTAGTAGIVVDKVEHKGDQFLLVLFNEQIFSFAIAPHSSSGGYWGSAAIVEYALEKCK